VDEYETRLNSLFDAFNKKDPEAGAAVLHPDVSWSNILGDQRLEGREAVQQMWATQFGRFNSHVSLLAVTPEGDEQVRARVYYVVQGLDGKVFTEEPAEHLFRFKDGLIVRMDLL